MSRAVVVLPGVTQVHCPVCRTPPGRPCRDVRGYLVAGGHRQRRAAWLAAERAERRDEAPTI